MRINVPESIRFRRLGEESVLLNLQTGTYFSLDSTGTAIWDCLVDKREVATALVELEQVFDVRPGKLQEDVEQLVAQLVEEKLLEWVEDQ